MNDRIKGNMESLKTYVNNPINATQSYFDMANWKDAAISLELEASNVLSGCKEHPQRALMAQIAILDDLFINLSKQAMKAETHKMRMDYLNQAFKAQSQSRKALATLLNSQNSHIKLTQNNFYEN